MVIGIPLALIISGMLDIGAGHLMRVHTGWDRAMMESAFMQGTGMVSEATSNTIIDGIAIMTAIIATRA